MSISRIILTLTGAAGVLAIGLASTARAAYFTSPYVSEEGGGPPTHCNRPNDAMMGFRCRGSYCDDVSLKCATVPPGLSLDFTYDGWTTFFSEESNGTTVFNYRDCTPQVVTGMRCSGSYCDSISIECDYVHHSDGSIVHPTNCNWLGEYSDENGPTGVDFNVLCGPSYFVVGARCAGSYCDRLSFLVCSFS